MDLNDFAEPEIAVTAAVTAALFSPRARSVMRKGLVYGIAGMLAAGDVVTSFARNVGRGVQQASTAATRAAQETVQQAKAVGQEEETRARPETTPASRRKIATKTEATRSMEGEGGSST
jgi:hypothetical protein